MLKLHWLPNDRASVVGKASRNGAWTTQPVRGLMWNVGLCSRVQQDHTAIWHVPSVGAGFGAGGSQGNADRLHNSPREAWKLKGWPFITMPSHLWIFPAQAVHRPNICRLRVNRTSGQRVRKHREKVAKTWKKSSYLR